MTAAKKGMSVSGEPPRSRPTVGKQMCPRPDADAHQANRQGTAGGGDDGEDQNGAEADLEGPDVLYEVLVVRLEAGHRVEEGLWRHHGPHRPKARKNTPAPTATALGGQAAVARRALGRIDDEVQRHLLCGASRDLGGVGASSLQTAGQGLEAGDEALHPNLVGQAVHDRWTA